MGNVRIQNVLTTPNKKGKSDKGLKLEWYLRAPGVHQDLLCRRKFPDWAALQKREG